MKKSKAQQINSMHLYHASRGSKLPLRAVSLEDRLSRNDSLENHQTGYFELLFFSLGSHEDLFYFTTYFAGNSKPY